MKIRHGFVSNSSSSSFICVIDEKSYKNIIKNASIVVKEVVKMGGEPQENIVENTTLLLITGERRDELYLNNEYYDDRYITINDERYDIDDALYELEVALEKKAVFFERTER
jgi:hypothetical protein